MIRSNQQGSIDAWMPAFIVTLLLLIAAIGFGAWAFSSRNDFKDNTDQKVAAAVQAGDLQTTAKLSDEFAQKEKDPLKKFTGPVAYGSVTINYPKTWSAYVDESGSSIPVNGYFNPDFVPGIQAKSSYAIRLQVLSQSYSSVLTELQSEIKSNQITVTPYKAANESNIGVRAEGQVVQGVNGSMVVLPLRDKTIKVWTESSQFESDFNNTILPSLNFAP